MTTLTTGPKQRLAYSVAEVARALGVHSDTVRAMIRHGKLRARQVNGPGSRVIVNGSDVRAFLDAEPGPSEIAPTKPESEPAPEPVPSGAADRIRAALEDGSVSPADAAALLRIVAGL